MFKFIRRIIYFLILVVVFVVFFRQNIGIWITQDALEKITGLPATITVFDIKLNHFQVVARNVMMHNPKQGYQEAVAMKIPLMETYYDLPSLWSNEPHFEKLVINIDQVIAVKNSQGELNLERMRSNRSQPERKFRIDELVLSIGDVIYVDEQHSSSKPLIYKIHARNKIYKNITSSEEVKKIVLNLILKSLPENLLGLGIEPLEKQIKSADNFINSGKNLLENFRKSKDTQPSNH
jgi:hypothetical protein